MIGKRKVKSCGMIAEDWKAVMVDEFKENVIDGKVLVVAEGSPL